MNSPTTRVFPPTRILALVVIGLLTLGLGYLRFAPDAGQVSVPVGAKAGDLVLQPCTYATEQGPYEADCGILVVPENRADPRSRLIALPVTRIHARSGQFGEPIFRLEGGPGMTNMAFQAASRFAESRDVVLVGYRGVDGSVSLDCPEVESALGHSSDLVGEDSLQAYGDAFRACADRLSAEGVDVRGYGLAQQVDDLEAARVGLGYERINLLSESAGTRTAMIYGWRYPESIRRSVMVGVNPPGHFLYDPQATDDQIGRYAELCAADPACGTRTDDLTASIRRTAADMPARWLFLPIKEGNVRVLSFFGFMQPPSQVSATVDAWLSAAEGDASGFWVSSVLGNVMIPTLFVWGQYAAAAAGVDAQAARDYFSYNGTERSPNLGYAATAFAWGGGRLADAWPTGPEQDEYRQVRTSDVETLLIGGELDLSTPPEVARQELLPYLPNGKELVLPGYGHTPTFWAEQPEAGTHVINTFFDNGQIDASLYQPQRVGLAPAVTFGALAKTAISVMLALATLTVLSLVWMARRVRKRGSFGPRTGAALRSLYPVVLGLGGWLLGALIILTAGLTIPIDNELLVIFAVVVPVGLGIYFAWVNRDWSAKIKRTGLAAVGGGAFVYAWLGFNAVEGLVAPLIAIVAAVAGGNLALIVLDIARARSPHRLDPSLPPVEPARAPVGV